MFPFEFSDETFENAMRFAHEHPASARIEYDEEAFQRRASTNRKEIKEVTKAELLNKKHAFLAKKGGIYCILHENGKTVYVGLADRFHRRFTTGLGRHTDPCVDCKNHWGHFVNPTRGSRDVGMPDGDCRYFILEDVSHKGNSIKQAEIDWYYLFRANGWADVSSSDEKRITNSVGMLGAKGHDGKPLYSVRLEDGELFFFPTSIECEEMFPNLKGKVREILNGHQSSNRGFTHRWATRIELENLRTDSDLDPLDAISEVRDVRWLNKKSEVVDVTDANRNSDLVWTSGRLNIQDIDVLRRRGGKNKRKEVRQSPYIGVYDHVDGKWRYLANTDAWKSGRKKRVEDYEYGFETDREAAIKRERRIVKKGWKKLNKPNFGWKPPEK